MTYRLMVLLETDEPGILRARSLVKELLEPLYGVTKTITVEEWFWQAQARRRRGIASDQRTLDL